MTSFSPFSPSATKMTLVARGRQPRKRHFYPFHSPLFSLQVPVPSCAARAKAAPGLAALGEGVCCAWSVSCLSWCPAPGRLHAAGRMWQFPGSFCSISLMCCDSSAELLTPGAARGYLWTHKAGGHRAGCQPGVATAKGLSSLGILWWFGWKRHCLVNFMREPPLEF